MRRLAIGLAAGIVLGAIAFGAGYALSSGPGRDFLRAQVESELSDLLRGDVRVEEVHVVVRDGLGLRGSGVRVYPGDDGPGIFAEHASIELNVAALLVGELSLSSLVVDGLRVRATLQPDGSWTFPPLQWLQNRTPAADSEPTPPLGLRVLAGAERAGRFLLEEERIASRIEIRGAEVFFEDRSVTADSDMPLQHFAMHGIDADLSRPWLSDDAHFSLAGTLTDPDAREVHAEWTGSVRDGEVNLALVADDVDLDAFDAYVKRLSPQADIEGFLSGSIRLATAEPGFENLILDLALRRVVPTIVVDDRPLRLDLPLAHLSTRIEIEPDAARLVDTRMTGPPVEVDLGGTIERPVTDDAKAHFEVSMQGLSVEYAAPIISQLPEETAREIFEWFDRIESGRVDRLALSGTAGLSTWSALAEGQLTRLPPNFLMSLAVSDVTARLDESDRVVGGSFQADWVGDRLELRHGRGTWRGESLPEMQLTVDGVSHFVGMKASQRASNALPTPGLPLVWDLLARDHEPDEATGGTSFLVDVDYLDHPIVRWPVEDAHLIVRPTAYGTESLVTRGRWGGVPVTAHIAYVFQPAPLLTVGLEATDAESADSEAAEPPPARAPHSAADWGRGRFRLEPTRPGESPEDELLSRMSGDFVLAGSEVRLSDVEVTLSSSTSVATTATVDLGDAERLGVRVQGHVRGASCSELADVAGLPEGFITGHVDVDLDLRGDIDPSGNPWAGLEGTVTGTATDGEVRQSVPLAVAMAAATDGFNPFAKREVLAYDKIRADLRIEDGSLTAERFELEGPVRIYATGTLVFANPPYEIDAVVGVFLLQRIRELLGKLPLVNLVLPGSKKGFVGAYFSVRGPWEEPQVTTMAMKSLKEELPDLITKPFDLIHSLWSEQEGDKQQRRLDKRAARQQERDEKARAEKNERPAAPDAEGGSGANAPAAEAPPPTGRTVAQ